jgi:hypothetical protein
LHIAAWFELADREALAPIVKQKLAAMIEKYRP